MDHGVLSRLELVHRAEQSTYCETCILQKVWRLQEQTSP